MPKKKPEEMLPGFEIYAKLKPILPFWQWFVAASLVAVLSLRFAHLDIVPTPLGVLLLILFFPGIALLFALIFRRRWITVGIKREGDRLLMAGQTVSENLANPSKVEFKSPTIVYIQKSGTRMQLREMLLRFASPSDAQKLVDWLHETFGSVSAPSRGMPNYAGDIWALVYGGGYVKRSKITFERNICFVVDPGNSIFDVQPKSVERKDEITLVAKTGLWQLGSVMMKFDSTSDADQVESKLRNQVKQKQEPAENR